MAKRLNKKVAIIGSLVLAMLIMAAIVVMLKMSRNPEKYLADARAAASKAEPDYKAVEKAYKQAFAYTKNKQGKIDILFELADMYLGMNEWQKVYGCWNQVINYDPQNTKARLAMLDYSYQLAESGNWNIWKDIESNVSELIDKKLDTSPRIYRIKGQALLELVRHGQATDKEAGITSAIETLQSVMQQEANNVDVYQYLADAINLKGQILAAKGVLNADINARQEAVKVLLKGVQSLPNEPKAYINLYGAKLAQAGQNAEELKKIETDILNLTEKFKNNPLPYFAVVQLYSKEPKNMDKAIAAAQKAQQLDGNNVNYALTLADLHYRRYSISKNETDFQVAMDIATAALSFPDSLDVKGPNARISFINRYSLHTFLANCFIEKAAASAAGTAEKTKWLEKAEQEVHEMDQLLGSADNPYAIMWHGRLLLVEGKTNEAIIQMVAAYDKMTAGEQAQGDIQLGRLSCDLAKVFANSSEIGAVIKYYSTAFRSGVHLVKPEILLDFASVLMRVQDWKNALDSIDFFEKNYGASDKSRILRVGVYIGANMYDEAQESIGKLPQDDPNTIRLRLAYLKNKMSSTGWGLVRSSDASKQAGQDANTIKLKAEYDSLKAQHDKVSEQLASLGAKKLTESEVSDLLRRYIGESQNDKAKKLADSFIPDNPNSVNVRLYRLMLDEPSPANVPGARAEELMVKAIESLSEPAARAMMLGQFYLSKGQSDKAIESYSQVLDISGANAQAVASIFDLSISASDMKMAQKMADIAGEKNLDLCDGEYFKARLLFAQKDYPGAIERINNCFAKRPVFSQGYMLKSQIETAMDKSADAIEDAKKAYQSNPTDGQIAKNYASILYERNRKLGSAVSDEQRIETRAALDAAIRANPSDLGLSNFYAEYISDTEPLRAIAICQQIQRVSPTVDNALKLAGLATRLAERNRTQSQASTFIAIAQDAYQKAYAALPTDSRVLSEYSEFLRVTGKTDEAQKILAGNDALLWRYYIRGGKVDEAQQILTKLYEANPQDVNTIKGLILTSRTKRDQAGILKYTAELLKIDKSIDNQILQIETYLEAGLTDDAQKKLDSIREKYPDEPRAIFLQAWLLARQGKLDDALVLANRNVELDKNNARVWQLRGQIHFALNKLNEALDDLQKSKAIQDNAEVRVDVARVYVRTAREEQAIVELKTAVDQFGSAVARNMLEEIYLKLGKKDSLDKFYAETIQLYPNGSYWYDRAGEFALTKKEFDKAYKLFDTAFQNSLKLNSESPDIQAFDGKLRALLEAKKYDQVLAEATKYLEGPIATIAYSRMARAKADTGDKNTATQYFRRALEKAGTNEEFIIETIRQMNQVVGFDETVKWCNERIQTQPDSLAINLALLNLYRMSEEYNKALIYADACIKLTADNEQANIVHKLNKANTLQMAFKKTGDNDYLKKTIQEYESILKKQPTNATVLNNLAYILADTGTDVSRALDYAKKTYEALPSNANVLDTYGYVLLKSGDAKQADEVLQRALQQFEQDKINAPMEVYDHIGLAKEQLKQDAEALTAYKRALELSDESVSKDVKDRISASIKKLSGQ
ncbi:MAG: hypothetical protein A2Y13_09445 [Planctomycetes bacterium GWC2_45_44]|nr:MAG: hypothetical protein A2Y13_09445 [Planctomycetes bacterium GWC2_45_44]HBR19754.1 hypothetical protein [Phycisphaerales bacterium]